MVVVGRSEKSRLVQRTRSCENADRTTRRKHLMAFDFQSISPGIIRFYIHTFVSLFIICNLIKLCYILLTRDIDFTEDKAFKHYYDNKEFLLSIWVMICQIIYFGIYTVIDMIAIYGKQSVKSLKIRKALHNIANYILFSIVFPLSIVVALLFWGFYYWDNERMCPKLYAIIFPSYMNHAVHTFPVPASILYMFNETRVEPPKSKTLTILIAFMTIYTVIFFEIHKRKGKWVYPVFEVLTPAQVKWLFVSILITSLIVYFLGYYLYNLIKGLRSYITFQLKQTGKSS